MPEPEVIDGYRAGRSERTAEVNSRNAKLVPGAAPVVPAGKRAFQACAAKYRIQITAPQDLRLSDGRLLRGDKAQVVQFNDHMAFLDVEKDALKIESIEKHAYYGKDFWDFAVIVAKAKEKQAQSALASLSDPAVLGSLSQADRERIVETLLATQDEEFDTGTKKVTAVKS
jgi:hypothetical protein